MKRIVVRLVVYTLAIWAAAGVVPGVSLDTSNLLGVVAVAVAFGIVNAVVKPVLVVLGFPFILVTLGLFLVVINGALLGLTAALTDALSVAGFWPALLGGLVVSAVVWFLEFFLEEDESE